MANSPFSPGFLPADNPISQWVAPRRNSLLGFGAGMLSNNWGDIGKSTMQGMALDREYAMEAEEQAKAEEQTNVTRSWLEQQGFTDLVPLVDAGQAGLAYGEALKRMQPGYGATEAIKPIEVNGQLVNPMTGEVLGDYRDPQATTPSLSGMPSDYQQYVLSTQDPGYAEFRTNAPVAPKAPTEAERKAMALTTVTQQDAALLFGDGTNPGIFDALGGTVDQSLQIGGFGINPLAGLASSDYKVAKDAISNITQSYLYAMSGATAPPEEVKKISEQVTPQPLDSPEQKAWKRERLLAMYRAIEGAQGNAAPGAVGDGWEVIGVQ